MLKTQMRKCWMMPIILGTKNNNMSTTAQLRNNSVTESVVSLFIPSFYCDNYCYKVTPSKRLQQNFVENSVIWFSSLILRFNWGHNCEVCLHDANRKLTGRRSFTYCPLQITCTHLYPATHYVHTPVSCYTLLAWSFFYKMCNKDKKVFTSSELMTTWHLVQMVVHYILSHVSF